MKILIIDDEQAILKMYSSALTNSGVEVITSENGENIIELIRKEKPAIIFLDIIMPKINGLDVLKQIKENEETKNSKVYLLTNLPEECSGDKAKELGAAGYFVKAQTEPKELLDLVNKE